MKVTCISVGKKHDATLQNAIAEYEKRLTSVCDFSWLLIPSSQVEQEATAVLRQLKDDDFVVLLDERGAQYDNIAIARKLESLQNQSTKRVVIIIGGAYGVSHDVMQRSNATLSFSKLVFPHQLMRLLVVEQLYRCYSILGDGKYHHQ